MSQNAELSRSPDYFAARAVEERRLATVATDEKARSIHLELAEKYAALAQEREPLAEQASEQQRSG